MTNLFTRIKNIVLADLHEALDQKEQKNPISLLNQYLRESEQETEKVHQLLERQYQLIEQFTKEYHQAAGLVAKRKHQVEIASQAGEIELAQFAEVEQHQYEERANQIQELLNKAKTQLFDLEQKYEMMKHKVKDMNIRRMELMGRENVARTQNKINQVIQNQEYSNSSYSRFNEIESFLDRLEKNVNDSYYRSTIDSKIAHLEKQYTNQPVKNDETSSIL